jgi:hypothetical protein
MENQVTVHPLTTEDKKRELVQQTKEMLEKGLAGGDEGKLAMIAVGMLKGLLDNTLNPDVVRLAIYKAQDLLKGIMPEDEVAETALRLAAALRSRNPLDGLF